jgi:hypothetical protein
VVHFEGLEENCCVPPDVQFAAGPNYVMEMVNLDGAIYTKSGSSVKEFGLEQLFNPNKTAGLSSSSDSMTDPVLLFDSQSNRWFAAISDTTVHSIRVAVSQTADPTGVWRVYNFPFGSQSDNCSDQPFMGVSEDKFVVTVNNWANNCKWYSDNLPPQFRGVQFTVANKSNLIAGSNSMEFMQSDSNLNYFSLHPVGIYGKHLRKPWYPNTAVLANDLYSIVAVSILVLNGYASFIGNRISTYVSLAFDLLIRYP